MVTAVLVMAAMLAFDLLLTRPKKSLDGTPYFLIFGSVVAVKMFTVDAVFKKHKRGQ